MDVGLGVVTMESALYTNSNKGFSTTGIGRNGILHVRHVQRYGSLENLIPMDVAISTITHNKGFFITIYISFDF